MSTLAQIEDRASGWLLRQEGPGWTDQDQAELEAWLASSSLHRVTYYRLEYGWRRTDRLAALRAPAPPARQSQPADDLRFSRRRLWRLALGVALTGVVVVGAGLWVRLWGERVSARTYATELGARASYPLEDGSRAELNTDSQLEMVSSSRARTAWVERGEVYFDVAPDQRRPFEVHAGQRLITALGTKFSVRRDADRVIVAMLEGRARVDAKSAVIPVVAVAGDRVIVENQRVVVEHQSLERIAGVLSWRQGTLTFDRTSLADVAREFNRYSRKKMRVDPGAAEAIHVGGTFDADNVEAFARLLQQAYRLNVEDDGTVIRISAGTPSQ